MNSLSIETFNIENLPPESVAMALTVRQTAQGFELVNSNIDSLKVEALKLERFGFNAKVGETLLIPWGGHILSIIGLGGKELTTEDYRRLGGVLARSVAHIESVAIGFNLEQAEWQAALVEGFALAAGEPYSLKSQEKRNALAKIYLPNTFALTPLDIENLSIAVQAVSTARQLVNMPSNVLFPESFAQRVKELNQLKTVEVEIWDFRKLNRENCAGILAVGAGSVREPQLVKISYTPPVSNSHLAMVGKGITFDTGGISLKPRESMAGMKYDMAGAASVATAVLAIAKMQLSVRVTVWMCIAENMPSGSAAKPNDVIEFRNGKTVEIMNTDAEGRLVLADGLILATEEKPNLIVDVATLTGAASVALGKRFGAVMGNEKGTELAMRAFGKSGEQAWVMPMPEELKDLLESPIADVANAKLGHSAGGMLLGAHFLSEFVGNDAEGNQIPWAHLDIAGPANNDGPAHGYTQRGATGYSVRTLIALGQLLAEATSNED